MSTVERVIPIDINGQRYQIRSTLEAQYIEALALYVDQKIRAAADSTPTNGDAGRVAVLAALNIADELFRCREVLRSRDGHLAERTEALEQLLDRVLSA